MLIFTDLLVFGCLTSGYTELSLSSVAFLVVRVAARQIAAVEGQTEQTPAGWAPCGVCPGPDASPVAYGLVVRRD
jgi:hypothetical protein